MNPLMQAEGLSKSFGCLTLFRDVTLGVAEGQRVGLVARNGSGKSTLLRILAGHETPDEGGVVFRRDLRVGYLEQDPRFPAEQTVLESCFRSGGSAAALVREYEHCLSVEGNPGLDELLFRMDHERAWDYERRVKQILTRLRITDFDCPVGQLSGGQLKRVALANVLIAEPDLLILDEPTNHLDLDMTEWLEEYLGRGVGGLLMVTHDRYFLDRVCTEIVELDERHLFSYKGNYAYYLEKRQERLDAEDAAAARARNLYRKELEWMRRMPQARGHKARYREEAFIGLEQAARRRLTGGETNEELRLDVRSSYIGSKIFEAHGLDKCFGEKVILRNFSYAFSRYEKMGIVGGNGTGKSTFIKILTGGLRPDGGTLEVGETVRFGYYAQEGMTFDEQIKVIDAVRGVAEVIDLGDGRRLTASQFLQHFLFPVSRQYDYVGKLSGGERRRLYLCTVLMRAPNFLVLDEPTNDLDIVTLQVLEEYLREFRGCVIVVSHDRYFMDKVVDHLLVFKGNGDICDFPGNYTEYRHHRDELERQACTSGTPVVPVKKAVRSARPRHEERKKLTYKERLEMERLEQEIGVLEQEKVDIETILCSGNLSVAELTKKSKRLSALGEELDVKTMRWLELSEVES